MTKRSYHLKWPAKSTVDAILATHCARLKLNVALARSQKRTFAYALARALTCRDLRQQGCSYPAIAAAFGLNASTVKRMIPRISELELRVATQRMMRARLPLPPRFPQQAPRILTRKRVLTPRLLRPEIGHDPALAFSPPEIPALARPAYVAGRQQNPRPPTPDPRKDRLHD